MGYWGRSSSLIRAFPAAPLGQTAPFMAGIWGLPLIKLTRPFSTATWMGHRTVHIPHTLNTEPAVMIFLPGATGRPGRPGDAVTLNDNIVDNSQPFTIRPT